MSIRFSVISVIRKNTAEVSTVHYTYEGDTRTSRRVDGAEWEEVEFSVESEAQPTIQIANITGAAFIVGNTARLIINDPTLFGTYKVGSVIEFTPLPFIEPEPTSQPKTQTLAN